MQEEENEEDREREEELKVYHDDYNYVSEDLKDFTRVREWKDQRRSQEKDEEEHDCGAHC